MSVGNDTNLGLFYCNIMGNIAGVMSWHPALSLMSLLLLISDEQCDLLSASLYPGDTVFSTYRAYKWAHLFINEPQDSIHTVHGNGIERDR